MNSQSVSPVASSSVPQDENSEDNSAEQAVIAHEESPVEALPIEERVFDASQTVESLTDEYFQAREDMTALNQELKEARERHGEFEELQKLSEQSRQIRKRMKLDEEIGILTEKAATIRERQNLLKEMIKMKLVENGEEEIKRGKRKLKVTSVLKEVRDEEALDFEEE